MMTLEEARARAWLEVDEDGLIANCREAQSLCRPETVLIAVLKADAYGYGAVETARLLKEIGVSHFSVACAAEGMELLNADPDSWVLNMGVTAPCELEAAIRAGLRLTAADGEELKRISACAAALKKRAVVHVKMDTGLHRLGFSGAEEALPFLELPWIDYEGLYSHMALRGPEQCVRQHEMFDGIARDLARAGHSFPIVHLLDSIGLTRYPLWQYNGVRIGAFLYGNVPPDYVGFSRRRAVGRFCARVTAVREVRAGDAVGYDEEPLPRDTRVATLSVGYVDGYPRVLSGVGEVEIRGVRARSLGLVCMDQMMVDVTGHPEIIPGDTAVLLGDGVSLNEFGAWGHLNRNEVSALIGRRVPRIYLRNGEVRAVKSRRG